MNKEFHFTLRADFPGYWVIRPMFATVSFAFQPQETSFHFVGRFLRSFSLFLQYVLCFLCLKVTSTVSLRFSPASLPGASVYLLCISKGRLQRDFKSNPHMPSSCLDLLDYIFSSIVSGIESALDEAPSDFLSYTQAILPWPECLLKPDSDKAYFYL